VGVVQKVVRDPEQDSFIDVIVKPAAHLDRLDEVMVITSTEPRFPPQQQQDMATSEALKGPEVEAEEAQKKASEIMAERLPGLKDPNAPANAAQATPGATPSATLPVVPPTSGMPHPPPPMHADRFTPAAATTQDKPSSQPHETAPTRPTARPAGQNAGQKKSGATGESAAGTHAAVPAKAKSSTQPRRNP